MLAELLQGCSHGSPHATRHPLDGTGSLATADVILALELPDLWNITHSQTPLNRMGMDVKPLIKENAKVITISSMDLLTKEITRTSANTMTFAWWIRLNKVAGA